MNRRDEQGLVNAILTLLTVRKVLHVHVRNTGAIVRRYDGSLAFGRSQFKQRGVPDVFAFKDGKFYGIEAKAKEGRVSPDQAAWLKRLADAGGVPVICRSVDDVEMALWGKVS